jgi:hypothetical protein
MPPTPNAVYNWACVLHSAGDIVSRSAQLRLSQHNLIHPRTSKPSSQHILHAEPVPSDKGVSPAPTHTESQDGSQALKAQSTTYPFSGYSIPRDSLIKHQFSLAPDAMLVPPSNVGSVSEDQPDLPPTNLHVSETTLSRT